MTHVSSLTGRRLAGADELHEAAELYTRVFRYEPKRVNLNPLLVQAIIRNGGSAVGVYDEERIVGFAYGFAGRDRDRVDFHYSQAAVVAPEYQGQGIGRRLKLLQRDVALEWGHERMRWTFDPLIARNGHFNLDSLGARGLGFHPDYYDRADTDRVMVEWDLTSETAADALAERAAPTPPALGEADWGAIVADGDRAWVAVPRETPPLGSGMRERVGSRIRASLDGLLRDGRVLVSCVAVSDDTSAYLAEAGGR